MSSFCVSPLLGLLLALLLAVTLVLFLRHQGVLVRERLWNDHMHYTREIILAKYAKRPAAEQDVIVARLMQNQEQLGHALAQQHRLTSAQETQLIALLKDHIAQAGGIVDALIAGNNIQTQLTAWYANGAQIAQLLGDTRGMMKQHLDQVAQEALKYQIGDYAGSLQVYDAIVQHGQHMAR